MNAVEPGPDPHRAVDPVTMVLSAIADVAPEHIDELATIDHDVDVWLELGLDSMDHLTVMDRLGDHLGAPIDEHDYPRLTTVRALADHVRTTGAHTRNGG